MRQITGTECNTIQLWTLAYSIITINQPPLTTD